MKATETYLILCQMDSGEITLQEAHELILGLFGVGGEVAAAPDLLEALIETDKDLCVLESNMAQIEKSDPRADGMTTLVSEWRKRNKKAINKAIRK